MGLIWPNPMIHCNFWQPELSDFLRTLLEEYFGSHFLIQNFYIWCSFPFFFWLCMLILSFCLLGLRWFVWSQSQSLSSLLTVGREYCVNRKTHQDVSQLMDVSSTTNYPHFPGSENLSYILLKRISEKALVEMSTIELRNKSCQQFSIRAAGQSVTGNSTLAKLKSCRIEK